MPGDDDILAKYGVPKEAPSDDAILAKYGVPKEAEGPSMFAASFGSSPKEVPVTPNAVEGALPGVGEVLGKGVSHGALGELGRMGGQNLAGLLANIRRFSTAPGDFIASKAGGALPLAGQIGGGLAGGALGGPPGAVGGAATGGALGEGVREYIGKKLGTYTGGPADQLKDIGASALTGAAGQAIASAPELPGYLANKAEYAAIRHMRPTPKVAESLGQEGLHQTAREVLDRGLISAGQKATDTSMKLARELKEVGAQLGDVRERYGTEINPSTIADRLEKEVIEPIKGNGTNFENQDIVARLQDKVNKFREFSQKMTLKPADVEAMKSTAQGNINYITDAKPWQQAQKEWASVLKKIGEENIPAPEFQPLKKSYGNLKNAELMTDRTAAIQQGSGGLLNHGTDMMLGMEALRNLSHGNLPLAGAELAGRALTKNRFSSTAAVGLDKLSRMLNDGALAGTPYEMPLKQAAIRGTTSLGATHYMLSKDEEYQNALAKAQDRLKPETKMISQQEASQRYAGEPQGEQ